MDKSVRLVFAILTKRIIDTYYLDEPVSVGSCHVYVWVMPSDDDNEQRRTLTNQISAGAHLRIGRNSALRPKDHAEYIISSVS